MAFQVCKNCVFYQPLGWYTRDVKVVGTRRSDNFAELLGALNSYDRRSGRMSGGVGGRSDKRIAAVKRCILKLWVFRASRHALMHL